MVPFHTRMLKSRREQSTSQDPAKALQKGSIPEGHMNTSEVVNALSAACISICPVCGRHKVSCSTLRSDQEQ